MSSTSKDAVTLRAKRSKKPSDGKMRRNVEIFVLSAPAILLFVCFVILLSSWVLITASISGRLRTSLQDRQIRRFPELHHSA